ncbi:MAG: hypothetical protein ACKOAS_05890, partial [Verrucomicrobiota bacterium]
MTRKHQGILNGKSVALLKGGPGKERDVSLNSGAAVANALRSLGAHVVEIDITGRDVDLPSTPDLVFNMIHGTFGEDGDLQSILDGLGIPYTGEDAAGSRLAFDKIASKRRFDAAGVPHAKWEILHAGENPTIPLPLVAKPPREGSSVGVHIVKEAGALAEALADCIARDREVLVEEFVSGKELTVGIVGMTLELAAREMDDDAGDSTVAHKQVGTAAHDHQWNCFVETKPHEVREALLGFRFGPELSRSADAHRRVFGKRLVKFDPARTHVFQKAGARFEIGGEAASGLVDVSCAEAENEIAIFQHRAGGFVDFGNQWNKPHGGMARCGCGIDEGLSGHTGNRRFAGGVDVGDENMVGMLERLGERILERLRSG